MQKNRQRKRMVRCGMWAGLILSFSCSFWGCSRKKVSVGTVDTGVPTPTTTVTVGVTTLTPVPTEMPTPEVTKGPGPMVTPESTETPTPEVTKGPDPTVTPELTETPTPEVTKEPDPTVTPELTETPTPEVTKEPDPMVTPEATPEITPEAGPTVTPEPTPTPAVTPEVIPDYEALIIGGWQKTEDFFYGREIYFPGKFTETALYAESDRYEYRYTAVNEPEVTFNIIGENGMAVQLFLDGLTQKGDICTIWPEGENDYGYVYPDGLYIVTGRVYGDDTEASSRRMRVEFRYPADTLQSEEYRFYIK